MPRDRRRGPGTGGIQRQPRRGGVRLAAVGARVGRGRSVRTLRRVVRCRGPPVRPGAAMSGPLPREARVDAIRAALELALRPQLLEVEDDSARHAGHAGARDGRGHFNVTVVSSAFEGLGPLARHRAVYAAVGTLMETDIHALSIVARTPAEAGSN